jgi:hypothetical protein
MSYFSTSKGTSKILPASAGSGLVDPESRRFLHCLAVLRHDVEYVEYAAQNQRIDEGAIIPISIETPTPSNPATAE